MAYIAKYLLSIEEFMDTEKGEALMERAFLRVDEARREKAGRMKTPAGRAACLGAGLILRYAVAEALRDGGGGDPGGFGEGNAGGFCGRQRPYSVTELLDCGKEIPNREIAYRYGEQGKPYFANLPFYFSLSHSGSYVLCGLSMEEIGADIQQHCGRDVGKLARRFYSRREAAVLEQAGAEQEKQFYRLWTRKEAYGKLTGKGIGAALGVDLLPEVSPAVEAVAEMSFLPEGRCLVWEEYGVSEDYSIAFCQYTAPISHNQPGTGHQYPAGQAAWER